MVHHHRPITQVRSDIGDTYGRLVEWENKRRELARKVEILDRKAIRTRSVDNRIAGYLQKVLKERNRYEHRLAELNAEYLRQIIACGSLREGLAELLGEDPRLVSADSFLAEERATALKEFGTDAKDWLRESEDSWELFSDIYLKAGDMLEGQLPKGRKDISKFIRDERGTVNAAVGMVGFLLSVFSFLDWIYKQQNVVRLRQWNTSELTYKIDDELKEQMDGYVKEIKGASGYKDELATFGFVFGKVRNNRITVQGFLPLSRLLDYVLDKLEEKIQKKVRGGARPTGYKEAERLGIEAEEAEFDRLCHEFVDFLEGRRHGKQEECKALLTEILDKFLSIIKEHKPGFNKEAGRGSIMCSKGYRRRLLRWRGSDIEPYLRDHLLGVFYYRDKLLKLDFPREMGRHADAFLAQMKQVCGFVPRVMPRLIFVEQYDHLMLHDFCAVSKNDRSGSPGIAITMNEEADSNCVGWNAKNMDIERIRFIDDHEEERSLWVEFLLDETSRLGPRDKEFECK